MSDPPSRSRTDCRRVDVEFSRAQYDERGSRDRENASVEYLDRRRRGETDARGGDDDGKNAVVVDLNENLKRWRDVSRCLRVARRSWRVSTPVLDSANNLLRDAVDRTSRRGSCSPMLDAISLLMPSP